MTREIRNRWTGALIRSGEANTIAELAIANKANLSGANLRFIRDDVWAVLSSAPREAAGLLAALKEGRVNGSAYEGECACLVGALANVRGCEYDSIPGLRPNSSRPAESFFLSIKDGDTPETSQSCKIAAEWAEEWIGNMRSAFGPELAAK